MKFTYDNYSKLLNQLLSQGYESTFYDNNPNKSNELILRHDIDFSPEKSLKIADIEDKKGVKSTYFFLISSPLYNAINKKTREVIYNLIRRGHRIGLHFDSHQYCDGAEPTVNKLEKKVKSELRILSEITKEHIDIVSFHNPPEWVLNRSFDGFLSTYEKNYFNDIEYVADSNQRWRSEDPLKPISDQSKSIQLLTHPILWGEKDGTKNEFLEQEEKRIVQRIHNNIKQGFI